MFCEKSAESSALKMCKVVFLVHNNQYVTEFNKFESDAIRNFQHEKSYTITCDFKIDETYKSDKIFMIRIF